MASSLPNISSSSFSVLLLLMQAATSYAVSNTSLSSIQSSISQSISSSPAPTFVSTIDGPYIGVRSSCWSQRYSVTVVGTVMVTVDPVNNKTHATTVYNTDVAANGSVSLYTRTDVDEHGTVTATASGTNTVAYPTGFTSLFPMYTWSAALPLTFLNDSVNTGSCCGITSTLSKTLSHAPLPPISGSTDPADPKGFGYALTTCAFDEHFGSLRASDITSIWANQTIQAPYNGCAFTACVYLSVKALVLGVGAVEDQKSILATTITTLSSITVTTQITSTSSSSSLTPAQQPQTFTPTSSSTLQTTPAKTSSTETSSSSPAAAPSKTSTSLSSSPADSSKTSTSSTPVALPDLNSSQAQHISSSLNSGLPQQTTSIVAGQSSILPPPGSSQTFTVTAVAPNTSLTSIKTTPAITLGSSTITQNSASQYVVGTQTLSPGSVITVSGTTISYPVQNTPTTLPPITIGTTVITAVSSKYVIGSQTLLPGSNIVVSGTTIRLASGGTQLVIGTSTEVETSAGLGNYIWTAIGGGTKTTSTSAKSTARTTTTSITAYRGDARSLSLSSSDRSVIFVLCLLSGIAYYVM